MSKVFELPDLHLSSLPTGAVKDLVDALGKEIATGKYEPGVTLPLEQELIDSFEVSRTVVREAIKVLSGKGMVRTARRYGTRVCDFESWRLMDPDVIGWHDPQSPMAWRIYRDSTAFRCIVEPEAARLAANHASEEQLQTISEAADCISPDTDNTTSMIAADYTFHSIILESSGNLFLSQLSGTIHAILLFSHQTGTVAAPDLVMSHKVHKAVADALLERKADLATRRMRKMLELNVEIASRDTLKG